MKPVDVSEKLEKLGSVRLCTTDSQRVFAHAIRPRIDRFKETAIYIAPHGVVLESMQLAYSWSLTEVAIAQTLAHHPLVSSDL